MHPRAKILLGLFFTFLVTAVAAFFFIYYLVTKSFPVTNGAVDARGLHAEVQIYRDEYGVPHIFAENEHDVYYALGWAHAQDRLWQMELARRAGEGRLAEILGGEAVKVDRMFRTLGIRQLARKMEENMEREARTAAEAYAEGVTSYIRAQKGKYPVEFDLLNIEPEPWSIQHSLMIGRLMGWELNHSRWVDIVLGELVEKLGEAKASEVFPTWPEEGDLIVPDQLKGRKVAGLGQQLLQADQQYRNLMGMQGLESGSNSWVVAGSKSVTGKPLLANDPHLILTAPGRWYEAHLSAPGLDVEGVTIAGIPFVVIGHNRNIAWGLTNAMMDDEDFYVEQVDSIQHPSKYLLNDHWRPIERQVDTILVKDAAPVVITIYRTHRGPVVNRIEPSAELSPNLLSMRWTGLEVSDESAAFYGMNHSTNWRDFLRALKQFAVPAQNFIYADVDGNIGYYTGGLLPIRKTKAPTLILPGWTDEYDWKGFVHFDEMPYAYNPPNGFIVTANNKIVSDSYPYYFSNHWEPHWRSTRITELLEGQEKFSVEDFERFQMDVVSPHAREIVPIILKAYDGHEPENPDVRTPLNYFRNWNFEMRKEDVATTLFQSFFVKMIENTLADEMGGRLMRLYDTLSSVPMSVTTALMKKGTSEWFDNVNTPEHETMNDIIRLSLDQGVQEIRRALGGELKEWRWGELHTVEFPHVFGSSQILKPVFNVGLYPVGGAHSTIAFGGFPLKRPFKNTVGPSTRQIYDLAGVDNTRSVLPPGQSGQVFHRHYNDQMQLWLLGGYRQVAMDRSIIERESHELLILKPSH